MFWVLKYTQILIFRDFVTELTFPQLAMDKILHKTHFVQIFNGQLLYFCFMLDSFKHKGKRKLLIKELEEKGISNKAVLEAFMAVPRHFFLDLAFLEQAYSNMAFRIGAGQTISHPFTVAFQSTLLNITKGKKVLEIGTGSGFQTCILCEMGAKVFSIERQKELAIKSKKIIKDLNYNPRLSYGDGYAGWEVFAPFDAILVTCGAPFVPRGFKTTNQGRRGACHSFRGRQCSKNDAVYQTGGWIFY